MEEFVKYAAWPIAIVVIALAFREPLSEFLRGISGRVSKLKVFSVEVELVSASSATATPLLDDIKTVATVADVADSTKQMIKQVQVGGPADYAVIDLGEGKEWLTSRLYVAAAMMERMRRVQVFVFVERTHNLDRKFVALASLRQLRWSLAQKFPWFEAAWIRANQQAVFPGSQPATYSWYPQPDAPTLFTSEFGAFAFQFVDPIVRQFVESLQSTPPQTAEWTDVRNGVMERGTYVTRDFLRQLLPNGATDAWAYEMRDASRAKRTRAVLRRRGDFVALLDEAKQLTRVANRRALLEEVGSEFGEEPEA